MHLKRQFFSLDVSATFIQSIERAETPRVRVQIRNIININYIQMREQSSMIIGCNISMIEGKTFEEKANLKSNLRN